MLYHRVFTEFYDYQNHYLGDFTLNFRLHTAYNDNMDDYDNTGDDLFY